MNTNLMRFALKQAIHAYLMDEVPVGAAVFQGEQLIALACNQNRKQADPTAHAEILAIQKAAKIIGNYRLSGTTLYVTLEPCAMCMGAIIHARIETLIYATPDPKTGCAGSCLDLSSRFNHCIKIKFGIMGEQSAYLLNRFFRAKRLKSPGSSVDRATAS